MQSLGRLVDMLRQPAHLPAVIGFDKLLADFWRDTFDISFSRRVHEAILSLTLGWHFMLSFAAELDRCVIRLCLCCGHRRRCRYNLPTHQDRRNYRRDQRRGVRRIRLQASYRQHAIVAAVPVGFAVGVAFYFCIFPWRVTGDHLVEELAGEAKGVNLIVMSPNGE